MLPGVRSRRHLDGAVVGVEVVPLRRLGRPGVSGDILLRRDGHDDAGDGPGGRLHSGGAVPPLIVVRGGELGGVVSGLSAEPVAAQSELTHDVAVPGGRFGRAVGRQNVALGGQRRNDCPADDPVHRGFAGAVGEQISVDQRKLGGVGAGVDAIGSPGYGHFDGVIPVPGGGLGAAVIGGGVLLRGNGYLNGLHRHIQAGGLGHALVGVVQADGLLTQSGECGAGVGVSGGGSRGAVRKMGGNDHAGRVEALQVLIDGFSGLGSDLDGDQDLFHGDGSAGRLGGPALRIGDGDLGDAVCQDRGGHGISGHFRGQAEAVARLHHHSGGVEALPGLIDRFLGRLGNSQALQLDGTAASAAAGQVEHLSDFVGITHFSTTSSRRIFTVRSFSGVISQWNVASPLVVMLSARMPVSPHSMKQSASPQTRYQ